MKNELSMSEIVETHKPKHFKFKYVIYDDEIYDELMDDDYDISTLDTINDDDLVNAALKAQYRDYQREDLFKKAKEPAIIGNGVIISKRMVTKADKKLLKTCVGFFEFRNMHYVSIKLCYKYFDIIEIFILT